MCLRNLEDTVLHELRKGQISIGLGDEDVIRDRVSLSQFYGIEINDFAVTVAEAALWISRLKANSETAMFIEIGGGVMIFLFKNMRISFMEMLYV